MSMTWPRYFLHTDKPIGGQLFIRHDSREDVVVVIEGGQTRKPNGPWTFEDTVSVMASGHCIEITSAQASALLAADRWLPPEAIVPLTLFPDAQNGGGS